MYPGLRPGTQDTHTPSMNMISPTAPRKNFPALSAVLLILALSSLLAPDRLRAQDSETLYSRYKDKSDMYLPLFRCRVSMGYEYPYNGAYTWDIDGFMEGEIMYEGKLYKDILLDINAHSQDVLLKNGNIFFSMTPPREGVQYFTRGTRKWLNLHDWGYPNAPEGFFELLYRNGDEMLLGRVDRISKQEANVRAEFLGPYTKPFNPSLTTYFEYSRKVFVLTPDGQMHRIRNKNAFLRLHKDRRAEVRRHMRSYEKLSLERWVAEAMKFLGE